jgi:hypothetical protein
MVISHTGIKTKAADTANVAAWYEKALAPLGYKKAVVIMDGIVNGFSDRPDGSHPDFWVSGAQEGTPSTTHHAFAAKSELELCQRLCPNILVHALSEMGFLWLTIGERGRSRRGRGVSQGWPRGWWQGQRSAWVEGLYA